MLQVAHSKCLMQKKAKAKTLIVLIDWNIMDVWLYQQWYVLFKLDKAVQLLCVAYNGSGVVIKVRKHRQTRGKAVGQDLNQCPCLVSWLCTMAASSLLQTLSDFSEIVVLAQKSSQQGSSSKRATEGFFYRTLHQRNEMLSRTLQQNVLWKQSESHATFIAAELNVVSWFI